MLLTVDSNLCAISSLTTDIFKEKTLGKTKFAMILLLAVGIAVANIPGLTVTHLFLMYGTLRAATLLPTVFTLKGIAICKTLGSLLTVILSGAVALMVSRKRGVRNG